MKKIIFTIADKNNLEYAKMLENSLRKFHTEDEVKFKIITPPEHELRRDPFLFYRATPYYAKDLIGNFDLVIKMDADQIVTGPLDYIFNAEYDFGTVYNWNARDQEQYEPVQVWDIPPMIYMNCGLVAMRSKEFIDHWWRLCLSPHFNNYRYKEQDLLNILFFYGNYKRMCFDDYDPLSKTASWYGLRAKGSWLDIELRGTDLIIPRNDRHDPERDTFVKVLHWAGGGNEKKMNYKTQFIEEVIKRLDYLVT